LEHEGVGASRDEKLCLFVAQHRDVDFAHQVRRSAR
jgi:hypothetical protein